MENSLTPNNSKLPQLQTISKTTTANALQKNRFDEIEKSVGLSAKDILDRPPIAMLKKLEGMDLKLEAFLSAQIQKLVSMVNINGHLSIQPYQIPIIAAQLIENYPVESIEDFVLCFKRGAAGFYGTIYKLDASVLCEWMKAYLDEKYTYVEVKVEQEKQIKTEESKINYELFKERVEKDFIQPQTISNEKENEYQRMRLANPYKYYPVEGVEIYATSQQHAEQLVEKMIQSGELVRVQEDGK